MGSRNKNKISTQKQPKIKPINKLNQALSNIQKLKRVNKVLSDSATQINELEEKLDWFIGAGNLSPELAEQYYDIAEEFADVVNSFDLNTISDRIIASGIGVGTSATNAASGSLYTQISKITGENKELYKLQNKLTVLYQTRNHDDEIREFLVILSSDLGKDFDEARDQYEKWKSGAVNLKFYGLAVRNLMEHFKGALNKLRVSKSQRISAKIPSFSWRQMTKSVKLNEKGVEKALLQEQNIHLQLHRELSGFMKQGTLSGKTLSPDEVESYWLKLKEHIWAISLLIDPSVL